MKNKVKRKKENVRLCEKKSLLIDDIFSGEKLKGLVIYMRSKPNRAFKQAEGVRDSL